jgi:hypothetical protein
MASASRFTYAPKEPPDKVNLVNDEWVRVGARCARVRAAMQRERDAITNRNAVTGAIFAGTTAALALGSGLYTAAKGDKADPAISAGLALGASGTAVPTFFYFGSDEREKVVGARMNELDAGLEQVQAAWDQFNVVDTRFTVAYGEQQEAKNRFEQAREGAAECAQLQADTSKRDCEEAATRLEAADQRVATETAAWHDATNVLDRAVERLLLKCR